MANGDSDPCPSRSRRSAILDESSSEDDDDFEMRALSRNRRRAVHLIDSSSSDSGSSIDLVPRRRASRPPVLTDSDSSSSGSDIVLRKRSRPLSESGSESGWSSPQQGTSKMVLDKDSSSSDSDGQSEKCPICLLTFKKQEVGSPEVCDHYFCVECIQEWSKNVNTCPVDRQPFNLILVRKEHGGKVIREIPIESATPQFEVPLPAEDPTFCEVCGSSDREDRMLLCDGCDMGYHLECLNPPLRDVPTGFWYCSECGPEETGQDVTIYLHEVELLLNDADDLDRPTGPRRRGNTHRVIPRTRQSERVRAQILTNRTQNRNQDEVEESIEVVVSQGPSTSRGTTSRARKKRRKTTRRKPNIKITYEINEETGQKIVIESKTRTYRRKKKKKSGRRSRRMARRAAPPKTVKKRLAVQLGMCAPRQAGQSLPDVKISAENNRLGHQRSQAGIPALHLFGPRNDLDYFSGSDADNEGDGLGVLARRRPNMSDVAIFRRQAQRKSVLLPQTPVSSSSSDLLGSILDSQEKFHSKHAVLSLNNDGSLKVDKQLNNNDNRVNLNDSRNIRVRKAPTYNERTPSTTAPESSTSSPSRPPASTEMDVVTTSNNSVSTSGQANGDSEGASSSYSPHPACLEADEKRKNDDGSQHSESELDIYSDIETVSTSKAEESDFKVPSPPPTTEHLQSDEDANNSDVDLVIDTEKVDDKTKEEAVSSTTNVLLSDKEDDEEDSEDGCPNFSIYSKESINLAQSTDLELLHQEANQANEVGSSLDEPKPSTTSLDEPSATSLEGPEPSAASFEEPEPSVTSLDAPETSATSLDKPESSAKRKSKMNDLYSDSDDDLVKIDSDKPFGIGDIRSMTEDISEEERSYTPCLDERAELREGLEGLDTEAISDEEKNDFDESHELKTASDGDALEINAKDSELDFAKPEEYEEGEIVDKLKKLEEAKQLETAAVVEEDTATTPPVVEVVKEKEKPVSKESESNKETFKKISKSNKVRNYRDKEKARSRSPSRDKNKENEKDKRRDRKKERRKEIERYNVRTVVAEKPRRMKDKFGRDARRRSQSRSSRSASPQYRSSSRGRRSYSREPKRRARSHTRSRSRKRSRSRNKRRSLSRTRINKRRKSRDRTPPKKKNRSRTRSPTPKRRRDWERRWTPSRSRSHERHMSPSWTPPRVLEKQPMKSHNLTVTVPNDSNKKKKDKKKADKRKKESAIERRKRKRDKTPPPSKEVFASGDNILVSVSFNKENDEREATVKRKRDDEVTTKRTRKEKEKRVPPKSTRKKRHDLSGVKPVAIIDLDRSPFKELTPSPKDVIILSDSENGDKNIPCDSSQQADAYATGPKTPPEPQVKFALNAKPAQMRPILNPLHEADEIDPEIDPQEELEQRLNDTLHKGPNTPPDPPNSPPSSPDAYDPFDPTKSRSPTPENDTTVQSSNTQLTDTTLECSIQNPEPSTTPKTPETKSHTPPTTDIQPADSQSNASANTPDTNPNNKPTPDVVIIPQAAPLVTSIPITPTVQSRINIIANTILPPVLPTIPKQTIKTATKQKTSGKSQSRKSQNRSNDSNDSNIEFDSPYSPGPSDYEDLFEPPAEISGKQSKPKKTSGGGKSQNTFDVLFGSSPVHRNLKPPKTTEKKTRWNKSGKIKQVGVKIDEDSLKILDDVPNSAVEMQVKDKFLKKLNRQERVVEEVKLVLKPHYNKKHINKEEYKDILRRSVPKICHNKSGEINPKKIQNLIEAYVKKIRHSKKVTSSSSVNNTQK